MFCLVLIKLEVAFKQIIYSVLIWVDSGLGTVGIFFLSHAIKFWFCGVSKLRWLVKLTFKILPTSLRENLKRVKTS